MCSVDRLTGFGSSDKRQLTGDVDNGSTTSHPAIMAGQRFLLTHLDYLVSRG